MTAAVEEAAVTEEAVHARRWLAEHGLPTGREEAWRTTPVDEVRHRLTTLPAAAAVTDLDLVVEPVRWHGSVRILLVDGVLVRDRSTSTLPSGLWLGSTRDLSPSAREHLTANPTDPPDGFEALNRSASADVANLLVADDVSADEPVHVVHVSTGAHVAHPRLVVDVGVRARLRLIETHVGSGPGGLTNASTTVHVARGAHVSVDRVQDEAADAVHVGRFHLLQSSRSSSDLRALSRGAEISRLTTVVDLLEPDASCRVTGLIAPRPGARHDDVVTVDHAASRCRSELATRAVVPTGARTSSSGRVIVRPGTVATHAHQRADSLLLDRTARADSRPWLEIFADDVRANHGSATGRLDDEALFYLRSRGIPREEARQVLVGAFARAVVDHLDPPSLRAEVADWFQEGGSR